MTRIDFKLEGSSGISDEDVLLAPMESNVIPLPHQIHALSRTISGDRVRYLLADEVGLGKTIEAGLVVRELKLRGLVRRTLIVAPKSLAMQWVAEMDTHFNESFSLVNPGDLDALERLMSLLDPMAFPDLESVTRDRVSEFVIRTEKRKAVTADGKPLFRPRTTQTLGVDLERNPTQAALYETVISR